MIREELVIATQPHATHLTATPCGRSSAEFHSKNKFEKSVRVVGFIIRIYHDARSLERQAITVLALYAFMELTGNLSSPFMDSRMTTFDLS